MWIGPRTSPQGVACPATRMDGGVCCLGRTHQLLLPCVANEKAFVVAQSWTATAFSDAQTFAKSLPPLPSPSLRVSTFMLQAEERGYQAVTRRNKQ